MKRQHKEVRDAAGTWLTLAEVATYLKLSREKLYRLAQQARIPASKIGQQWRFRRDKVDAWMEEHENTRLRGHRR